MKTKPSQPALPECSHAFVIRIWREPGSPQGWRGHITHAVTRRRIAVHDLDQILGFIQPYCLGLASSVTDQGLA